MVDEVTIEHVLKEVSKRFYYLLKGSGKILATYCHVDLSKLEGYEEIRTRLYKFFYDKLLKAGNFYLVKKYLFFKLRVLKFWEIFGSSCFFLACLLMHLTFHQTYHFTMSVFTKQFVSIDSPS